MLLAVGALGAWVACSSNEGTQDRALADGGADSAAPVVDAGSDAHDAAAEAAPGCAGTSHTFCEDFDTSPLGGAWTETRNSPETTLSLASDVALSPPRSLRVDLPGGAGAEGQLAKTLSLASGSHGVKVGFDWSIAEAGVPDVVLVAVTLHSSTSGETSRVTLSAGDLYTITEDKQVGDGGVVYNPLIASTVARATPAWTRIECQIDESGGARRVTLRVGGASVLDAALTLAVPAPYDTAVLTLGPERNDYSSSWLVHVDNVTFDALAN